MKTTKILACVLACVLAGSICTSCGTSEKTEDNGKIKISVGQWPSEEGDTLDRYEKSKKEFEEANPDIEVEPDTWTFDLQTVYPKAEAGLLPTTFAVHFTELQKMTDGEYIADMTDALKEVGLYDKINPNLLELATKDGRVYAVPADAYVLGMPINIKLWKEAGLVEEDGTPKQPENWEQLGEYAKIIKDKTGVPGFALCTTKNCGGWFFTNIAWSYGVSFMDQDKNGKWKATFDTPEAVAALQFVKDLKWKYDCVPANNLIDQAESHKLLATGQTATIIDGPVSDTYKYDMDPADYGMIAIPRGPKGHYALMGGTLYCSANNATYDEILAGLKWRIFMGYTDKISEEAKVKKEQSYKEGFDNGEPIGIRYISPWSDDSDTIIFRNELIDKYTNVLPNSVRLYNESLTDPSIVFHAEEPVCCQDLYGILDNIIQEVFTNKDADPAELISRANSDFQKNFLDKLEG